MKKALIGNALLIGSLLLIALGIYLIHYFIFGDIRQTISGVILSLAYVPIGMLYEVLILDKILEKKEKLSSAKRMNLIIGSFYHEIGHELILLISRGDVNLTSLENEVDSIFNGCDVENFDNLVERLGNYKCELTTENMNLMKIYSILERRDDFILSLITNSTLDNYTGFIEMLISSLHLRDELQLKFDNIKDFEQEEDKEHLLGDICDAYTRLLIEWVGYMKELRTFYPELFAEVLKNSVFNKFKLESKI